MPKNALHSFAANGDFDNINDYLTKNPHANINEADQNGLTPLMYAAKSGNTSSVLLLLRNHADPTVTINNENVAQSLAKTSTNAVTPVVLDFFNELEQMHHALNDNKLKTVMNSRSTLVATEPVPAPEPSKASKCWASFTSCVKKTVSTIEEQYTKLKPFLNNLLILANQSGITEEIKQSIDNYFTTFISGLPEGLVKNVAQKLYNIFKTGDFKLLIQSINIANQLHPTDTPSNTLTP